MVQPISVARLVPQNCWFNCSQTLDDYHQQHTPPHCSEELLRPCVGVYLLGLGVAKLFLGMDWLDRHASPEVNKPGYFKLNDKARQSIQIQAWRMTDLGELLFNLQHVPGFEAKVVEIKKGDPESGMAELHVARALVANGWTFRFVERSGERGKDYDYEIVFDRDVTIAADTKCKIEGRELTTNTIVNTLSKHIDQLAIAKPGVFFIKFPGEWLAISNYAEIMIGAANKFFKEHRTSRVVSVIFYSEPVTYDSGVLAQGHRFQRGNEPVSRS